MCGFLHHPQILWSHNFLRSWALYSITFPTTFTTFVLLYNITSIDRISNLQIETTGQIIDYDIIK